MASVRKIVGVTAAVAVVGCGVYYVMSKAAEVDSLIKNIQFNVTPSKIRLDGGLLSPVLKVYLNVGIVNPTKLSISFEKPTVWIYFNGSCLASSTQSTDKIKLEQQGTTTIRNIELSIPITSNFQTFMEMGRRVFQNVSNSKDGLISQLKNNLSALLPLLSVKLKTYIGKAPIEYETSLSSQTEEN